MDLENRLEMLLELHPESLDPRVAETLMDEVLAVFRKHLPLRSLEGLLEKRGATWSSWWPWSWPRSRGGPKPVP
ncbi:hypothetical protein [Thermus albus]|uniref:hypothetical protein n=1 Tax=Thermus albus TaxID=2908146 RepID=UPI001FA98BDE|nr:hypothetical protein [Thermus albus]